MFEQEQSLEYARKYRPNTLSGYIGNDKLKSSIMGVLKTNSRPQVIMLSGPSGCGKTTFARLIAKEYSCSDRNPETGACGQCPNCQAIDEYILSGKTDGVMNIKEINIADQSGKRDMAPVLADMEIQSFGSEWKVYIFDECHEASSAVQNQLLKIAEAPPENVLLIFCTTNPERMIETLKNRCQLQLEVSKPKLRELEALLKHVCLSEQVGYDAKGLRFIANRSEMTIRTALKTLNRVVLETGSAKYDDAVKVFETVENSVIVNFYKALKDRDVLKYVTLISDIKEKMSLGVFLSELKDFTKRGIYAINSVTMEGVSDNELLTYRRLFGELGIAQVSVLLNKLLSLDKARDLEMEFLIWGYSGLIAEQHPVVVGATPQPVVTHLPDELKAERNQALTEITRHDLAEKEDGVKNASALMQESTEDDLLAFGGVEVVDAF